MVTKSRKTHHDAIVRRGAIMVVDLDNFTSSVLTRGINAALRDVLLVRKIVVPLFKAEGGEVYKVDADNEYVFFDRAEDALRAASRAHDALAAESARRRNPLAVSIGIGFGRLIYLPGEDDYYGAEFNLAAKLGEEIAEGAETLVTADAWSEIRTSEEFRFRRIRRRISGVDITAYRALRAQSA